MPEPKRRRTRKDRPLLHGDVKAADAVTVEHVDVPSRRGNVVKRVLVPLVPLQPGEGSSRTTGSHKTERPQPINQDLPEYSDQMDMGPDDSGQNKKENMVWLFRISCMISCSCLHSNNTT